MAKGMTADEAYQKAGFKPNRGNAATLKANQSILDRVAEIQGKASAKAGVLPPEVTFPAVVFEAVLPSAGPSAVRTTPT